MENTMLKLLGAALLMDLAVVLIYLAERKTPYGRLRAPLRQVIAGVLFGALAILGTEFGVTAGGATLNVRDAAPLCAGLIFGAPAGVIAGVIGGVERWFAVYWGAGAYTRLACSLATVLAGLFGAALRVHMLDNKKPSWFYGLLVGLTTEVLHMLMIFVTNMDDVHQAFTVVKLCAAPMIVSNGVAVMLAVLAVSLIGREPLPKWRDMRQITQTFQRWLLVCVLAAFGFTCAFTYFLQTRLTVNDAYDLLRLNIEDVRGDIQDASDENLLALTRTVAFDLSRPGAEETPAVLAGLSKKYSIAEINIVGGDGVITASTNPDFVGFNMASGEQSAAFLPLLSGEDAVVQSYQPISYDASISRKYAGVPIADGARFLQVGYDAEQFQRDIDSEVVGITRNRHIGESGYVIICDRSATIISDRRGHSGLTLSQAGMLLDSLEAGERLEAVVYGTPSLCMFQESEGYYILAVMPRSEAMFSRDVSIYVTAFMEIVVFAAVFASIYFLIKHIVVDNIRRINHSLSKITSGNLDVTVDVRANEEFASLSNDINATVDTLKRYIAEAEARIDKELEFARTIQNSALPSVFPPYPHKPEFSIYAMMDTAKEVGGDFYDFYLLGEDRLAFLMADVSGKGIPAAMFMMTAKTLVKSLAEAGLALSEVFTRANEKLCEGNDAGMFVTAWLGVLELSTGCVTFVNAGHNPPLVKRADGAFAYLKEKAGFVLAGMEGVRYREQTLLLGHGDTLFLYTDGVTEATDASERLYGEDRLRDVLDRYASEDVQSLTERVKADVDEFVGDAPQFDDITMLALRLV